jgi:hypothetical protein
VPDCEPLVADVLAARVRDPSADESDDERVLAAFAFAERS